MQRILLTIYQTVNESAIHIITSLTRKLYYYLPTDLWSANSYQLTAKSITVRTGAVLAVVCIESSINYRKNNIQPKICRYFSILYLTAMKKTANIRGKPVGQPRISGEYIMYSFLFRCNVTCIFFLKINNFFKSKGKTKMSSKIESK